MTDPIRAALVMTLVETVALVMIWMLPKSVGKLVKG